MSDDGQLTMDEDLPEAEITPTDIVFDCPDCGHNLVVDYRAAGLQVPCSACGKIIQVPIPEGMQLDDLDQDPGELLQQLLQTRRMLVKNEAIIQRQGEQIVELDAQLRAHQRVVAEIAERVRGLVGIDVLIASLKHD